MTRTAWKMALLAASCIAFSVAGTAHTTRAYAHTLAAAQDNQNSESSQIVTGRRAPPVNLDPLSTQEDSGFLELYIYPAMPELVGFGAPVPDPAMLAIFGIGLLAIGLMRLKDST